MFKSYIEGFLITIKSIKLITTIYGITLLLGLLVAIPFFNSMKGSISGSLLPMELLKNFDYTSYIETGSEISDLLALTISLIKWMGAGYFIFGIFFTGGIISLFGNNEVNKVSNFFRECSYNFWRFFRTVLYVLILQLISFVAVLIPAYLVLKSMQKTVESESTLVYTAIGFLLFYIMIFSIFNVISDITKIKLLKEDSRKVIRNIWSSLKFVINNPAVIILYLLHYLAPLILLAGYLFVENIIGVSSGFTIFLVLIIQQFYIWMRIFNKSWLIVSERVFYDFKKLTSVQVKSDQNEIENEIPAV